MTFQIDNRVKGIGETEIRTALVPQIEYFGFYSGTARVGEQEIEFWRDKSIKSSVVVIVDTYLAW